MFGSAPGNFHQQLNTAGHKIEISYFGVNMVIRRFAVVQGELVKVRFEPKWGVSLNRAYSWLKVRSRSGSERCYLYPSIYACPIKHWMTSQLLQYYLAGWWLHKLCPICHRPEARRNWPRYEITDFVKGYGPDGIIISIPCVHCSDKIRWCMMLMMHDRSRWCWWHDVTL